MKVSSAELLLIEKELSYLRTQMNGNEFTCSYKDKSLEKLFKKNMNILNQLISKIEHKEKKRNKKNKKKEKRINDIIFKFLKAQHEIQQKSS